MKNFKEEYVGINGIEHYFLHYPCKSDKVILYLHGGPGQSEAHFAYLTVDERINCNFVFYDQRGAGKTQSRNRCKTEDLKIEGLIDDLNKIILHIKDEYRTKKIILVGHSWGTALGTEYIKKYPNDVLAYIGVGQMVDDIRAEKIIFNKLGELINERKSKGDMNLYQRIKDHFNSRGSFDGTIGKIRKLQWKYGLGVNFIKLFRKVLRSPLIEFKDIRPFLTSTKINKRLMDFATKYNTYDHLDYKLPIFYICGRNDWVVPSLLTEEYYNRINAPKKKLFWIENAGHVPNLENTAEYNKAMLDIISELE